MASLFLACRVLCRYPPCFRITVSSLSQTHLSITLAFSTLHYKIQHRNASIANLSLWSIRRAVLVAAHLQLSLLIVTATNARSSSNGMVQIVSIDVLEVNIGMR